MIQGERVLITGGMGFIGTNFCRRILDDNEVTVYDTGERDALAHAPWGRHPNLRRIHGDVLDTDSLRKVLRGKSIVLHMAAIAGVGNVVSRPVSTFKINLMGTANLFEAMKGLEPKRIIVFSTSEVYGPKVFRASENDVTTLGPISQPRWVYATSKLAAEFLAMSYSKELGLPVVAIRPFNVYGPCQLGEGAIRNFVDRALRGEDLIVHGDGDEIRSWCFIDDFIDGLAACCEEDAVVGETINLGNPQATYTTLTVAREVIRQARSGSLIAFKQIDYPEIELRVPSIEKAARLFGFSPTVDVQEGIAAFIDWYRERERSRGH